jgi:predicted ATPase
MARAALQAQHRDDARRLAGRAIALAEAADIEADELTVLLAVAEATEMPEVARLRALARAMDVDAVDVGVLAPMHEVGRGSPHRTTRFIGRTPELAMLATALSDGADRVLVVFGLGGIGKTRLVARVAQTVPSRHSVRFPDGAVFVTLDGVIDETALVGAVATTMLLTGVRGSGVEALASALRSWRGVLVLDNVEQVEGIEHAIRTLTEACPHLTVLASSRRRLALHAAHHIELTGLRTDADAGGSEASRLFIDRAARAGGPTTWTDDELATVHRITTLLDGHPLAVELAAAMTRALDVATLHAHLSVDLGLLEGRAVDVPERHHDVTALLDPTWQQLDANDRLALIRLATFATGFTLEAAKSVAELGLQRLLRLVDVAVVSVEGGGRGRYRLHPIVRSYARERADAAAWTEARRTHAAFIHSLLVNFGAALATDRGPVVERLAVEREEVRSAVEFVLGAGDVASAGSMLNVFVVEADMLHARGGDTQLIDLVETVAEALLEHGDRAVADRLLTKAANATRVLLGDATGAIALYQRALAIAEEAGDVVRQAGHHAILAMVLFDRDREESDRSLARARALAEDSTDEMATAEVLSRVLFCVGQAKDWHALETTATDLLECLDRIESVPGADRSRIDAIRFNAMHNRAVAVDERGDKSRALALRRQALAFAEQRGHLLWQGYAHGDIARGLMEVGELQAAAPHAERAHQLFRQIGAHAELAAVVRDLGPLLESRPVVGPGPEDRPAMSASTRS